MAEIVKRRRLMHAAEEEQYLLREAGVVAADEGDHYQTAFMCAAGVYSVLALCSLSLVLVRRQLCLSTISHLFA